MYLFLFCFIEMKTENLKQKQNEQQKQEDEHTTETSIQHRYRWDYFRKNFNAFAFGCAFLIKVALNVRASSRIEQTISGTQTLIKVTEDRDRE